eukprot:403336918
MKSKNEEEQDSEFEDQDGENLSDENDSEQDLQMRKKVIISQQQQKKQSNDLDYEEDVFIHSKHFEGTQSPDVDEDFIEQDQRKQKAENQLLMPLIQSGMSMSPDMKFGWKPKDEISGAPIPLYYEFEQFSIPINPLTNQEYEPLYLGPRYKHSLALNKVFANQINPNGPLGLKQSYAFKVPPNIGMIEQIIKSTHRQEPPRDFLVNFTKRHSLYSQGMRICVSKKSNLYKWERCGDEIAYQNSRIVKRANQDKSKVRYYNMLSFTYLLTEEEDKIFFSYAFPYTFSKLQDFISNQRLLDRSMNLDCLKEDILCKSLGGVDVPLLTISSRIGNEPNSYHIINLNEFDSPYSRISLPYYKRKKIIMITARVHPGESNSSYMMTSMSGNDLNRKYHAPDEKLHPTVCAIKSMISGIVNKDQLAPENENLQEDEIFAFVDMHGHSRKKNVFIYGPYYPLHNEKYLKMRIIPKLLSEETTKFRYFSCKFRIEKSKEKAARIVLWREFNIMNCFTFEASFHGYLNEERVTEEFNEESFEKMGEHLINSLYEYKLILEEENRLKKLKELNKKKKKKKQNEEKGKKKKLSIKETNQISKKASPRQSILEDVQDQVHKFGYSRYPNEPPVFASDDQPVQQLNISGLGRSALNGGIRSMKQMMKELKKDEKKRSKLEKIEDEECKSDQENDNQNDAGVMSGSDSDPQDDELSGNEQNILFEDIKEAITQFNNYYNGNKKPVKLKNPKVVNSSNKTTIVNQTDSSFTLPMKKTQLRDPDLSMKIHQQTDQQLKKKQHNSTEEPRKTSFQPHMQKSRLISNNVVGVPQNLNKSAVPIYNKQNIMNSGYYIIQSKNNNSFAMNDNPLIINKIVTDLKGIEFANKQQQLQQQNNSNNHNKTQQFQNQPARKYPQNKISHQSYQYLDDLKSNQYPQNTQYYQSQTDKFYLEDQIYQQKIRENQKPQYQKEQQNLQNSQINEEKKQQNQLKKEYVSQIKANAFENSFNNTKNINVNLNGTEMSSTKKVNQQLEFVDLESSVKKRKYKNNTPIVQRISANHNNEENYVFSGILHDNQSHFSGQRQEQQQHTYQNFYTNSADIKQKLLSDDSQKNIAYKDLEKKNLLNTFVNNSTVKNDPDSTNPKINQAENKSILKHNNVISKKDILKQKKLSQDFTQNPTSFQSTGSRIMSGEQTNHQNQNSNNQRNFDSQGQIVNQLQNNEEQSSSDQQAPSQQNNANCNSRFEEKLQNYYAIQNQMQQQQQYVLAQDPNASLSQSNQIGYQFPTTRQNNVFRLQKQKYYSAIKKRAMLSPKTIVMINNNSTTHNQTNHHNSSIYSITQQEHTSNVTGFSDAYEKQQNEQQNLINNKQSLTNLADQQYMKSSGMNTTSKKAKKLKNHIANNINFDNNHSTENNNQYYSQQQTINAQDSLNSKYQHINNNQNVKSKSQLHSNNIQSSKNSSFIGSNSIEPNQKQSQYQFQQQTYSNQQTVGQKILQNRRQSRDQMRQKHNIDNNQPQQQSIQVVNGKRVNNNELDSLTKNILGISDKNGDNQANQSDQNHQQNQDGSQFKRSNRTLRRPSVGIQQQNPFQNLANQTTTQQQYKYIQNSDPIQQQQQRPYVKHPLPSEYQSKKALRKNNLNNTGGIPNKRPNYSNDMTNIRDNSEIEGSGGPSGVVGGNVKFSGLEFEQKTNYMKFFNHRIDL